MSVGRSVELVGSGPGFSGAQFQKEFALGIKFDNAMCSDVGHPHVVVAIDSQSVAVWITSSPHDRR